MTGCGEEVVGNDPGIDYPPPGRQETLAIGTGEVAFEAFDDGDPLPLVAGFQGGVHVWVSLRVDGLPPGDFLFDIEMEPVDGSYPAETTTPVQVRLFDPDDPQRPPAADAELVGWPARIRRPRCFLDRETRLRVLVVEADGDDWAEEERRFVPIAGDTALTPDDACAR